MKEEIIASAPGKLLLLGEYAVLEAAPALVLGVSQRAEARVLPGSSAGPETPGETRLPTLVLDFLRQKNLLADPCRQLQEVSLDTADFFAGSKKLGLGSSAALTVATMAVFAKPMPREQLLPHAVSCHRQFQGGFGSGADTACSLFGGLICFMSAEGKASAEPLTLPEGLFPGYVWTGTPSSTSDYLQRLAEWKETSGAEYDCLLGRLVELAEKGADLIRSGDPQGFMGLVQEYDRGLWALSQASRLGFYSQVHEQLARLVRSAGGVYKPSGAGGGDFGLFFGSDRKMFANIKQRLADAGYATDLVSASDKGLRMERRSYAG